MGEQTSAESIRRYAIDKFVAPAKVSSRREVRIPVRAVHDGLGLANQHPAVCEALSAKKFQRASGVKAIKREGPAQSATTVFVCEL